MADDTSKKDQTQQAAAPAAAAKKLPLKTVVVILAMLVIEGGVIVGLMSFLGKPSEVKGVHLVDDHSSELEKLQEIPVLDDRFPNSSSGRLWIWSTEVIIQAKAKHADDLIAQIESRQAELRTGIGTIWASAQDSFFREPNRETLTRQTLEYLRATFKQDATGEDRVHGVLIPKLMGFPADL